MATGVSSGTGFGEGFCCSYCSLDAWVGSSDACSLELFSGSTIVSASSTCATCFHSASYAWRLHYCPKPRPDSCRSYLGVALFPRRGGESGLDSPSQGPLEPLRYFPRPICKSPCLPSSDSLDQPGRCADPRLVKLNRPILDPRPP